MYKRQIIGLSDVGILGALLGIMAVVLAAHALYLPLTSIVAVFIKVVVLSSRMLLEEAARSINVSLTAAPPHVVTVLRPVHLARPIEILFLREIFLTVKAEL